MTRLPDSASTQEVPFLILAKECALIQISMNQKSGNLLPDKYHLADLTSY